MNQPFLPGPPPLDSAARTRAFLDAGARTRVSKKKKLIIVVVLIVLAVGSCAAVIVSGFGHLGTEARITAASNGEIRFVTIFQSTGGTYVNLELAPNVSTTEANRLVCQLVLPELAREGIHPAFLSVGSSDGGRMLDNPGSDCPGGVPNS